MDLYKCCKCTSGSISRGFREDVEHIEKAELSVFTIGFAFILLDSCSFVALAMLKGGEDLKESMERRF